MPNWMRTLEAVSLGLGMALTIWVGLIMLGAI